MVFACAGRTRNSIFGPIRYDRRAGKEKSKEPGKVVNRSRIRGANSGSVDKIDLPLSLSLSVSLSLSLDTREGKSRPEVVARNQSSPLLSKHNKTADRGKNRRSISRAMAGQRVTLARVRACACRGASMAAR